MRILLLILLLLVAATIFSILYRAPTAKNLKTTSSTTAGENGQTITTKSFVNSSGSVTIASDKGYATIRTTKDGEGKTVLEEYLDEENNPITLSSGYASIAYTLEDGLATTITYLDETGEPTIINNGYSSIHRSYNDRGLADTDTYWINDTQVLHKNGYAQYSRTYNEKKQSIMLEYRDLSGELLDTSSGYARRVRDFNEAGKVSEERYYRADGSPAVLSLGQSGYTREYDDQGRTVETTYLGAAGQPINTNKGYSRVTTSYGSDGSKKTQYFDINGSPVTIGSNQYGILTTAGEAGAAQRIYLDEDGEVMQRLDNILGTRPYLVLVLCVLLAITALCLKGKARWAFLILYVGFVLYMTMAWREPGNTRTRFELFASYRRFLTNSGTRQQIVNNVLLFVPFGTVLCSLIPFKSAWNRIEVTILICALTSVAIEAVQYCFGIGLAEADDLISNTLGGCIGSVIALLGERQTT